MPQEADQVVDLGDHVIGARAERGEVFRIVKRCAVAWRRRPAPATVVVEGAGPVRDTLGGRSPRSTVPSNLGGGARSRPQPRTSPGLSGRPAIDFGIGELEAEKRVCTVGGVFSSTETSSESSLATARSGLLSPFRSCTASAVGRSWAA